MYQFEILFNLINPCLSIKKNTFFREHNSVYGICWSPCHRLMVCVQLLPQKQNLVSVSVIWFLPSKAHHDTSMINTKQSMHHLAQYPSLSAFLQ